MSRSKLLLSKMSYKYKLVKRLKVRADAFRQKSTTLEQREAWNNVVSWLDTVMSPCYRTLTKNGAIGLIIEAEDIDNILEKNKN